MGRMRDPVSTGHRPVCRKTARMCPVAGRQLVTPGTGWCKTPSNYNVSQRVATDHPKDTVSSEGLGCEKQQWKQRQ